MRMMTIRKSSCIDYTALFTFLLQASSLVLLILFLLPIPSSAKITDLSHQILTKLNQQQHPSNALQWPGWTGYFGWNYESATALMAFAHPLYPHDSNNRYRAKDHTNLQTMRKSVLRNGLEFPQEGYWMQQNYPVIWFYSAGDRIGLFGSLYYDYDASSASTTNINDDDDVRRNVYCKSVQGVRAWPQISSNNNLKTRYTGWGALLGLSLDYKWVWADDVFMAGAALVHEHPEELYSMLSNARSLLLDEVDGLWFHGANVGTDGSNILNATVNGVKWGRANAWMFLALGYYVDMTSTREHDEPNLFNTSTTTQAIEWLYTDASNAMEYQRPSGAFGNVVDERSSPDETSFTSAFIYAVGVLHQHPPVSFLLRTPLTDAAQRAHAWLEDRDVDGIQWSDTAGAMHLQTTPQQYNAVMGVHEGPAIAMALWAQLGKEMMRHGPADLTRQNTITATTTANKNACFDYQEPPLSPTFYLLSLMGCIVSISCIGSCCCFCYSHRKSRTQSCWHHTDDCLQYCCSCCYGNNDSEEILVHEFVVVDE